MKKNVFFFFFIINSICTFSQVWTPIEMRYNIPYESSVSGTIYAFVEADKIVVKTSKSAIVVSNTDTVGRIQKVIQKLFIEKRTPVVSDTIEINPKMKRSHRAPVFSVYRKDGDNKDVIGFYSCDTFKFKFCDDFLYLLKFMTNLRKGDSCTLGDSQSPTTYAM